MLIMRLTLPRDAPIFAENSFDVPDTDANMAAKDDYLLDQLIDLGYVTRLQVDALQVEADAAGAGVVDMLIERKIIRSQDLTTAKAAHFGFEVVNLGEMRLDDEVISAVPRHIAKRYKVIPIFKHGHSITVALSEDRKSTRLNSSHSQISYAVFCLKKKKKNTSDTYTKRKENIYIET